MKQKNQIRVLAFTVLLVTAFGTLNVSARSGMQNLVTPSPTRQAPQTPPLVDQTIEPFPPWVTDFADPILAVVSNQKPAFQDDFSRYRGWLNEISGIKGRLYADLQDDMLLLELPERTKESFIYNPKLKPVNFVLTLDLRFYHGQPKDTVRFQFDHASGQQISFDLSNDRNWELHWGERSLSGKYEHFPPEHIPLTIIMLDGACAFYLNNDPLVYSNDCREDSTLPSKAWTVTFRLLRGSARAVVVNFDNLKLWDLDVLSH